MGAGDPAGGRAPAQPVKVGSTATGWAATVVVGATVVVVGRLPVSDQP